MFTVTLSTYIDKHPELYRTFADHIWTTTDFILATTIAAFITFEKIDFIAQLSCFARLIALFLKHAFDADLLAST